MKSAIISLGAALFASVTAAPGLIKRADAPTDVQILNYGKLG